MRTIAVMSIIVSSSRVVVVEKHRTPTEGEAVALLDSLQASAEPRSAFLGDVGLGDTAALHVGQLTEDTRFEAEDGTSLDVGAGVMMARYTSSSGLCHAMRAQAATYNDVTPEDEFPTQGDAPQSRIADETATALRLIDTLAATVESLTERVAKLEAVAMTEPKKRPARKHGRLKG